MADRLLRETKPAPGQLPEIIPGQYWDQTANEGLGGYERVQGSGGAPRVLLWGPDGSALMTAEKPGYVDVTDRAGRSLGVVSATNLDMALSVLRDAITGTGAGAKTQADIVTSLAAILAKIIAAPATEAKQDTLIAKDFATQATLEASRVLLNTISSKDFATQATLEASRVLLANLDGKDYATQTTLAAILTKIIAAPATEAKQDVLAARVGNTTDAAVTNPTLSASEIALLKGILSQLQGNGTGTLPVNVAGGVTISGDTTLAGTVIMRDATDPAKLAKVNADGSQVMQLSGSNPGDAKAVGVGDVNAILAGFNGGTYDRWRNNEEAVLLASAARIATTLSPTQTNYNARGLFIGLEVTAASGTGGLIVHIQGLPTGFADIIRLNNDHALITTTGRYGFVLYPGIPSASTVVAATVSQYAQGVLPRRWRVRVNHADGSSYTYLVIASLIL